MEKKSTDKKKATGRPPVTEDTKFWVFGGLLRNPDYFGRAVSMLKKEHFAEHERWLSLVWTIATSYYREYSELPPKNLIMTKCNSALELDPQLLSTADIDKLNEFLAATYNFLDEDWPEKPFMSSLQQFLEDRLLTTTLSSLQRPQTPVSLSQVFSKVAEEAASLSTLSSAGLEEPFMDNWFGNSRTGERIPTNISFIDKLLEGGQVRGESYGLLGPTGGGKTTIGVMITVEAAVRSYKEWVVGGRVGQPARAYHVSYEDATETLRMRAIAYAAKIPKKRVEEMIQARSFETLSTPGNLQEYEKKRYRKTIQAGKEPPCELQRYTRAREILNLCWRIIDFTGLDPNESQAKGNGLIDEIAAYIRQDISKCPGLKVSVVGVDYVLAACEAYIEWMGRDHSELRHMINRWPWNMRRKIAGPFNCPVWSMQQLNTESNELKPGAMPRSNASAEGKAFNHNCDFCFLTGIAMRDGRVPFTTGKHRRTAELVPTILQIQGDLCRVVDASHKWVLNERTRSIDPRQEADRFAHATEEVANAAVDNGLTSQQLRAANQQRSLLDASIQEESLT